MSYSSASTTKNELSDMRAETPKSIATPPIRNPGAIPACSRIQASSAVAVVFPCVPATASTHFCRSTFSDSHCGPDV